jgi:heme-degrading monooxygenase HmoA
MVARMARYRFEIDPTELAKKHEEGLLPIFMKQPGFRDYSLFADGDEGHFIALTLWDSLDEAQAGVEAAWAWVRENMSEELQWTNTEFVDVLLSTSFGVSPSWEDPK